MQLSCAANELLVIEDAFYGRKKKYPRCGCIVLSCKKCQKVDNRPNAMGAEAIVRKICQGLQQCDVPVEDHIFGDPCRRKTKYLEATYHCEERKNSVTFGGGGKGPGRFQTVGGLTVSSTNEIFVSDEKNKRIQVFSMKGAFLRSFPTGYMRPQAISTGHNDTLWVVFYGGRIRERYFLYENSIHQYNKEGQVLAKFNCNSRLRIYGLAWHKLSDRVILSLTASTRSKSEAVWFSPTYTQATSTCNMTRFALTREGHFKFVTVDKKGNIFIVDERWSRVLKYDKNGVDLSSFGSKGRRAGDLYYPSGICVDSLGRVIVADSWNSRVEMFTAEGDHIRTVAYMHEPVHVATGGEGQLVVSNQEHFVTILLKY